MGVGARLKARFAEFGIRARGGCNCDDTAKRMDRVGPLACRDQAESLLDEIQANAREIGIPFVRVVVNDLLQKAIDEEIAFLESQDRDIAKAFETRVQEAMQDINEGPKLREVKWQLRPEVIEAAKRIIRQKIGEIDDRQCDYGSGRGIVTLGGGIQYFPAVFVLCRSLRRLGCALPIEVWHLGAVEFDDRMASILKELGGIEIVDGKTRLPRAPRSWGGWEAKAWAIQHSSFREVLFLDSDIMPAGDPSYLFDDEAFRKAGAIAWPNYDHAVSYEATAEAFEICGLPVPGRQKKIEHQAKPTDYRPWETGQLLVDTNRCWKALEIAKVLSDYSDFFYPPNDTNMNWHSFGDTATFPFGFWMTGTEYRMPDRDCEMFGDPRGGGLNQYDMQGRLAWQHRCRPKFKIRITGQNPVSGLALPDLFNESIEVLKAKWRPYIWDWRDQDADELAAASHHVGGKFCTGLPGVRENKITLLPDGKVSGGNQLRWRLANVDGERRMIIAGPQNAHAILKPYENGWIDYERGVNVQHMAPSWWAGMETPLAASVWCEVFLRNVYRLPDRMDGWRVVDVGANEGVFSHLAFERGAATVVSCEPVKANYARLVQNMDRRAGSICVHAACTGRGAKPVVGMRFGTDNPHLSGMEVGPPVDNLAATVDLDRLHEIATWSCTALEFSYVDLLKIDCEGYEWPILLTSDCLDMFQAITAELHFGRLFAIYNATGCRHPVRTKEWALKTLREVLEHFGFDFRIEEVQDGNFGYLWAWKKGTDCVFKLD